jgi:hypothetical protein
MPKADLDRIRGQNLPINNSPSVVYRFDAEEVSLGIQQDTCSALREEMQCLSSGLRTTT